jgi:small-conductance mechanosensitive channel
MEKLNQILESEIFTFGTYILQVSQLASIILIIIVTKAILWVIKKAFFRKNKYSKIDTGSTYALLKFIKYVVWVLAISLVLESIGVIVTLLLAGSAALLVGIGRVIAII